MNGNPKLEGTNIIDCIPQTGQCPMGCDECFYNDGGFYRTKGAPLFPCKQEAEGKIVRVNSGHDSNVDKGMVIETTKYYKDKFYNTSIPRFDFPGPVVFTCNGRSTDDWFHMVTSELHQRMIMFVRVRLNYWNTRLASTALGSYLFRWDIPVVLTPMRYKHEESIPFSYREAYERKTHVLPSNQWWCPSKEVWDVWKDWTESVRRDEGKVLYFCGSYDSPLCKDCGNCEGLYERWKEEFRG